MLPSIRICKLIIIVNDGATFRIGPFALIIRNEELQPIDTGDRIRLDVDRVMLETNGKRRLDNLSFALEPGQLVALVGDPMSPAPIVAAHLINLLRSIWLLVNV